MSTAANSRRAETSDIVIAVAIATLGAAAIAMPGIVLYLTPPCLISLIVDDVCWGCGITHAALAFLHGDFAAAWAYNKLSVLVLPMLLWLYFQHLRMVGRTCLPILTRQR